MMNEYKKIRRIISLLMTIIIVVTSIGFSPKYELKANADENLFGYNISFGPPKGSASAFSFPKAKVTGNGGVTTAKNVIFSLSTGYIVSSKVEPTITDLPQGGKHQTLMWYWDEPKSLDYITEIIRGVVFEYTDNMSVEITVDGNDTNLSGAENISFLRHDAEHGVSDGDGLMHYYIFIKANNNEQITWKTAYDYAKSLSCLGLRGYLTTCTSATEDKIYDRISEVPAWAGGARIDNKLNVNDAAKFVDTGVKYDCAPVGSEEKTSWKWICGPEAGRDIPLNITSTDTKSSIITYVTEGYTHFKSEEPNNYGWKNAGDLGEWLLELHYGANKEWNDYHMFSDNPRGYFVEFSYYDHLYNNPTVSGNGLIDGYNKKLSSVGKCVISSNEDHIWDFETTRSDTISAKCVAQSGQGSVHNDCEYIDKALSFSVSCEDIVYDGEPVKEAEVEGDFFDVVNFLGYEISITYEGINQTVYESSEKPPKDIGDYKATVKLINKKNLSDEVCYAFDTFRIKKQNTCIIQANIDSVTYDYDGSDHGIVVNVTEPNLSDCTIRYGLSKDNITLTENPKFKEGVHTVWYEITADGYMQKSGSAVVTVNPREVDDVSLDYQFNYDGKEHKVVVNYPAEKVSKVLYSEYENGPFKENCPVYKDAIKKDIYVKIIPQDKAIYKESVIKAEFVINKATLEVKNIDNLKLTYNGKKQSPALELLGILENDTVVARPNYIANEDYTNAGECFVSYEINNLNYELPDSFTGLNYEIVPKNVTLKAMNASKVLGKTDPEFEYTVDGLCENDKIEAVSLSREKGENIGNYKINVSLDESKYPNYEISTESGIFTISDHKKVVDAYKAATCTDDGLTEGCHCEECGEIIVQQEVIPAKGHDFSGDWIIVNEPTDITEGLRIKKCKNGCEVTIKESIPALKEKEESNTNAGKVSKISEITKESPIESAFINNTKSDLLKDKKIFDNQDIEALEQGKNATVWLSLDKIKDDKEVQEEAKALSKELKKIIDPNSDYFLFDLKLYKQIENGEKKLISETENAMAVSIKIPENLINKEPSVERNYYVLSYHDGKTYSLNTHYDNENNRLIFNTNKFSLYSIGYKDVQRGLGSYNEKTAFAVLPIKSFKYTGNEIRPTVKVYYSKEANSSKEILLKENVDYIVEYENNINVGIGIIRIIGIGDYSLELTKNFAILENKISILKIQDIPSYICDGTDLSEKIKDAVVIYGKNGVVDKSNFNIEVIGDSSKAGKVKVVVSVKPNGNYRGTKKLTKNVYILSTAKYDLSKAQVTVSSNKALVYDGKAKKPKVSVTIDGKKVPKKEYTVVFSNNINAGTAYVTVKGKNNSSGTSEKIPFEILPADFNSVKIKKIYSSYWHTDMTEINPSVKLGKIYLKKDVDYVCEVPELDINELNDKFAKSKKFEVVITLKSINPNFKSENSTLERKVYIYKRDISKAYKTNIITGSKIVNGEEKPEIIVSYINDSLKEGEDYTVKYNVKTNKKTGITSVKAVVKGCGKYCGKRKISWEL